MKSKASKMGVRRRLGIRHRHEAGFPALGQVATDFCPQRIRAEKFVDRRQRRKLREPLWIRRLRPVG